MNPEIALLLVCLAVMAVVMTVLYLRYRNLQLLHQERMAAIEKGVAVPVARTLSPWSPRVYLLRGLIWSASGLALMICLLGLAVSSHRPESTESRMWRAKTLTRSLGISMDQAQQIVDKDQDIDDRRVPLSIALLGLIPLGVGIAYLDFYYSDETRRIPQPEPATAPSRTGLGLT
ncbi:MAG: hypothetical protein ABSH40_07225 [Bryobacteraceae bacterium]